MEARKREKGKEKTVEDMEKWGKVKHLPSQNYVHIRRCIWCVFVDDTHPSRTGWPA